MTKPNSTPTDLANLVYRKLNGAKISHAKPSAETLIKLFETLFFTSLKTEEGQFIQVTITFIDPTKPDPSPPERIVPDRWQFVQFESPISFTVKNLVKLSKAADVWSSSLAVYYNATGDLFIWGMIDQALHYQSFLNYESESGPEQPGLFQSTISGIGSLMVIFDYELIASLSQDILISNFINVFERGPVKEILETNSNLLKKEIANYIAKEFHNDTFESWDYLLRNITNETLSRLLLRIQNYQHGGALLITDRSGDDLDIKYRIKYKRLADSISRAIKITIANFNYSNTIFNEYLDNEEELMPVGLYLDENVSETNKSDTRSEMKGAIRFIASLSCVDGLVLLDDQFNVNGFGAVIKMKTLPTLVYTSKTATLNEEKLGKINPNNYGTRHRSMFSYCWHNEGSLGFIISQDGEIRAVTKINGKLIMWENIKVHQFLKSRRLKRQVTKK